MSTKISKKVDPQVADFFRIFGILDTNKNEILDEEDLTILFKRINFSVDKNEIQDVLNTIGSQAPSKKITFAAYLNWFQRSMKEERLEKLLGPIFDMLDENHDGVISGAELVRLLTALKQKLPIEESNALVGEKLDFLKFIQLAKKFISRPDP